MSAAMLTAVLGPFGTSSAYAAAWDPRVQPIARQVEKLRGLSFEHPVPVEFLSETAFVKRVAVDRGKLSADDKEQLRRAEAQLRSAGLVDGDVDLVDALTSLQTTGALAYYDPKTKRATVRGKQLTPSTKVTLAHELTHALQDQHFDLRAMQKTAERTHSSSALTALVEGDAVRVQDLFTAQLPSAERAQFESSRGDASNAALGSGRAQGVPDSLLVLFQSPYVLGPQMLQLVQAVDGKRAIDRLFRHPPDADSDFLAPTTLVDGSETTKVPTPALRAGEQADGKPDVFGAFALYLMLAARADPVAALAVADGWAGDAMITFRRGDTTCVRSSFASRSSAAVDALLVALQQWVAAGPAGVTEVERDGVLVTLTACDPEAAGDASGNATGSRAIAALTVAAVRNSMLASIAAQGLGVEVADCTANALIADPSFRPVLDTAVADPNGVPDSSILSPFQQRVVDIALSCAKPR
jgi:hypothetical protein